MNTYDYKLLVAEGYHISEVADTLSKKVSNYLKNGYTKDGQPFITVFNNNNHSSNECIPYFIISQVLIK